MCWIFGYKGVKKNAQNILIHWLERLEYRWYDSAGIYVSSEKGDHKLVKAVWKVSNLATKVQQEIIDWEFTYWIAHTRWATHWGISEENTHPHHDMHKNFYIVHNWIIENYHKLKQELISKGYEFYGQTDTEVIANLLDYNWDGNFEKTVEKTLWMLRWAYALLIISARNPWEIIWAKIWSPMIFWYTDTDFYFASDKQALVWYAENLIYLDDWDIIHLKYNDYLIKSNWIPAIKNIEKMDLEEISSSKWDFHHFMEKEIHEQPNILRRIFKWRVDFENKALNADAFHWMENEDFNKIIFVWCWTSYNAGHLWTYWMQNIAWIESYAEIASEYEYKNMFIDPKTLYVFISQSWETADSLETLKILKAKGAHTFGIVNVVWSSISRLTDSWLFTRAGAEIWVASTKAFTAQITCILLLALFLWKKRNLTQAKYEKILNELEQLPVLIENILSNQNIDDIAKELARYKNFFFLWRQYQLPIANESSLKFKEITYLHSECYASWELKHWPLALIDENIPSVLFVPNDLMFEKNLSSIQEINARKWKVITVSDKEIHNSDYNINIPSTIEELYPFLTAVAGQVLAYKVATELGREIDKPRNLAKSVTVK